MDKEALLTNYFSNQLSQEERKIFDELLDADAEFKARFDFEQNLQRAIKAEENQNVKAKLISFEKEIARATPKSSVKKSYRNLAVAASIALLIGLAWFGYINGTSIKYEDLYAQNFQEYPNTVYAITRSGSEESLERTAFVAYESGNYDAAIEKFEQIPSKLKQPYIDFFLGQSYMNAGRNDQAKAYFRKTIVKADNFVAESHWYLAMIALKEKDKTEAESELKKLINGYAYHKERAVALLKELD